MSASKPLKESHLADQGSGAPLPADALAAPPTYNVVRSQDGALVVSGVGIDLAYAEAARLNAEASMVVGQLQDGTPIYRGMFMGECVRYSVRTPEGLDVVTSQTIVAEVPAP